MKGPVFAHDFNFFGKSLKDVIFVYSPRTENAE